MVFTLLATFETYIACSPVFTAMDVASWTAAVEAVVLELSEIV